MLLTMMKAKILRAAAGAIVIIAADAQAPAEEARQFKPTVVLMGEGNAIERRL